MENGKNIFDYRDGPISPQGQKLYRFPMGLFV